jgi:hypothetical protein
VRWTELENFVINEGRLESRPGFEVDNFGGSNDVPAVQPAPIVALAEIFNPGSSATGRESYSSGVDVLTPNATNTVVAGWSGTHTSIDEGVPGGDAISTGTQGAAVAFGWTNPVATYASVLGVAFHGRARINANGSWAKLNFYFGRGVTAGNLIASRVITTREEVEANDWEDFYFVLMRDLTNDKPLTNADLDNMEITVELDSSESLAAERILANGDGSHQEWLDAQDGGTAVFTDCKGQTYVHVFDESNLPTNQWIRSNGADTRQTFTFSPQLTYATITNVSFSSYVRKPGGRNFEATIIPLIVDDVATDWEGSAITIHPGQPGRIVGADNTTNPKTSAAWTKAEISSYEFGFKKGVGAQLALGNFGMTVSGTRTGGVDVQIDVLNAQVVGAVSSLPGGGLRDKIRLFSSNLWHNRYDDDTRQPTITDVTNSVPLDSSGPGWPVDWTQLYGQVYLVNGTDPTVYYPDATNTFAELATNNADGATKLTGRSVAGFGNRLFYGWVTDDTTVTPERVSFSKWQDGSTHNHRSAGDFDLLDTPGGVLSMIPLDEQVMSILKEKGAYVIRATGNDLFPFIRDVIDFEVGQIGIRTASRAQFASGPAVIFLGMHPSYGVNVYTFDGRSVQPVGGAIARKLREDMNFSAALLSAHSCIDPRTGTYWLFVPENNNGWPTAAWVMNLQSGQWTRATFPYPIFSSGIWHFPDRDWLNNEGAIDTLGGYPTLTLGTGAGYLPVRGGAIGYDEASHPSSDTTLDTEEVRNPLSGDAQPGQRNIPYTAVMTTGDLVKPAGVGSVTYKFGVLFKALDPINRVLVDASIDGGQNYTTQQEIWFGPHDDDNDDVRAPAGGIYYDEWSMEPLNANQVRYRFSFTPYDPETYDGTNQLSDQGIPQRVEIHDIWVVAETGEDS